MVLVDTSIWISSFNRRLATNARLGQLILENQVLTTKIIQAEVAQGARTEVKLREYWDCFLGLRFVPIDDEDWKSCATNFLRARKKGVTPGTIDCLHATLARRHAFDIWSMDRDFQDMRPILGFDLFDPG